MVYGNSSREIHVTTFSQIIGDDRLNTAARLAIGAAELLERIALRARHADPGFGAFADEVSRLRTDIVEVLGWL